MLDPIRLDAHNPGPLTGEGNHTYLLIDPGGSASLVDAGVAAPAHLAEIDAWLARTGAHLDTVLITHGHRDHVQGAPALASRHRGIRFYKFPQPGEDSGIGVDCEPLTDGMRISAGGATLVALHTPGHSPDHVAFWHQETATMFSGDLVIAGGSVTIQFDRGGDVALYLRSLERLRALRPSRLLPAHGPEVREPDVLLRDYVEHRLMRERQVLSAVAAGHTTVPGIAESIYDGLAPELMPSARETIRAHLEKLKHDRRAVDHDGRWKIRSSSDDSEE